ncbi:MAG TPA: hypothetical protein DCE41_13165 [Cytophagales bacterium]|nr:hypothetical protein [Cytophagales bacterium]HAA19217.1 hypothetical protein [Cytophagales bacterium]HAP62923.1 hypothetical protein [Cytophagales bacterium]
MLIEWGWKEEYNFFALADSISLYHLHKGVRQPLHFEMLDATAYTERHATHCFVPHRHSFYQLIWFQKAGRHFIDYTTYDHEPDTLYFINLGQVHNFCDDSDNSGVLFHFNDAFLHHSGDSEQHWLQYKLFTEVGSPLLPLHDTQADSFEALRKLLWEEYTSKVPGYEGQVYHLFQVLLTKVERMVETEHVHLLEGTEELQKMIKFRSLMEDNLDQMHEVGYYADALGISPKKLTELTKRYLGDTPAHLLYQRKVLEAKRLLSHTGLTVKEVGYRLGFTQATYFTKYFKKQEGITPKEFAQKVVG